MRWWKAFLSSHLESCTISHEFYSCCDLWFQILALPGEVLVSICTFLDPRSVRNFAMAHQHFLGFVDDKHIWRSISLTNNWTYHNDTFIFLQQFAEKIESVRFDHTGRTATYIVTFAEGGLSRMINLCFLFVSSPYFEYCYFMWHPPPKWRYSCSAIAPSLMLIPLWQVWKQGQLWCCTHLIWQAWAQCLAWTCGDSQLTCRTFMCYSCSVSWVISLLSKFFTTASSLWSSTATQVHGAWKSGICWRETTHRSNVGPICRHACSCVRKTHTRKQVFCFDKETELVIIYLLLLLFWNTFSIHYLKQCKWCFFSDSCLKWRQELQIRPQTNNTRTSTSSMHELQAVNFPVVWNDNKNCRSPPKTNNMRTSTSSKLNFPVVSNDDKNCGPPPQSQQHTIANKCFINLGCCTGSISQSNMSHHIWACTAMPSHQLKSMTTLAMGAICQVPSTCLHTGSEPHWTAPPIGHTQAKLALFQQRHLWDGTTTKILAHLWTVQQNDLLPSRQTVQQECRSWMSALLQYISCRMSKNYERWSLASVCVRWTSGALWLHDTYVHQPCMHHLACHTKLYQLDPPHELCQAVHFLCRKAMPLH